MKRYSTIILLILSMFVWLSCDKDNMDGPNAQLFGEILNAETGEMVEQDIYNGSLLRYIELGYDNPPIQIAYFMVDGSFRNNLMFSGKYDFFLNQGNFVPDTVRNITLKKGENHITFNVTPYLTIYDVTIEKVDESLVQARFKIRQNTGDKISKIGIFVHRESCVGDGTKYDKKERLINGFIPDGYEISIDYPIDGSVKELQKGKPYYFRVGALSEAPAAKYNYAHAVRLTL